METIKINVVIPSHKRANNVTTKNICSNIVICVPESQYSEYKEYNPNTEIITHPDSIIGLPAKRNWIMEFFGNVMQLDDDLTKFISLIDGKHYNPDEVYDIIQYCGNMAYLIGAKLFGFNHRIIPTYYSGLQPFELSGYINGCNLGILKNDKLKFNPKFATTEDYYISCLNAYYYRIIFKDNRFCFHQSKTFKNPGGLSEYRNLQVEEDGTKLLQQYFGDVIRVKKSRQTHTSTGRTFGAKMSHAFERTLHLPF